MVKKAERDSSAEQGCRIHTGIVQFGEFGHHIRSILAVRYAEPAGRSVENFHAYVA